MKISLNHKGKQAGENNPFYGKKHSEDTLNALRKPVRQYDDNGAFMKEYDSAKSAASELGLDNSSIGKCCKNKSYRTVGGFIFKYATDDNPVDVDFDVNRGQKQVTQCDLAGNVINSYKSITAAGKIFENSKNADKAIGDCCRGRQKTAYGFRWEYA